MRLLLGFLIGLTWALATACSDSPTTPQCIGSSPRSELFAVPVPLSQAKICWLWREKGVQVCQPLDNPKIDTYIITGGGR